MLQVYDCSIYFFLLISTHQKVLLQLKLSILINFYNFHDLNKLQLIKVDTTNSILIRRKFKFNQKKKLPFNHQNQKHPKAATTCQQQQNRPCAVPEARLSFSFLWGRNSWKVCLMTAVELGKVEQKVAKYQVGLHLSRILGPNPNLVPNSKVVNIT